jgi:hypothetical protein
MAPLFATQEISSGPITRTFGRFYPIEPIHYKQTEPYRFYLVGLVARTRPRPLFPPVQANGQAEEGCNEDHSHCLFVVFLSATSAAADTPKGGDSEFTTPLDPLETSSSFDKAQCVVIVSSLNKGAFLVGGKYGRGFAESDGRERCRLADLGYRILVIRKSLAACRISRPWPVPGTSRGDSALSTM